MHNTIHSSEINGKTGGNHRIAVTKVVYAICGTIVMTVKRFMAYVLAPTTGSAVFVRLDMFKFHAHASVGVRALNYCHPYSAQFCIVSPRFFPACRCSQLKWFLVFRIYGLMSAILSKLRSEYPNEWSE